MAHNVEKNSKDEVVDVQLDEVILPGDPRHGVHNPVSGQRDALSVHSEDTPNEVSDTDVDAIQKDYPESDLPERPPLVREIDPSDLEEQPVDVATTKTEKSSSKSSDKSDKS